MTILNALHAWRGHRRAEAELRRLADRELHDAGIPRWRIAEIARGGAIDPRQVV